MTEAEESVLAALLVDSSTLPRVRSYLIPDDFPSSNARDAYIEICNAADEGKAIDAAIVSMRNGNTLSELRNTAWAFVSSANINYYCQALQAQRLVRSISAIVGDDTGAFGHRPYAALEKAVRQELEKAQPIPDFDADLASDVAADVLEQAMAPMSWDVTGYKTGLEGLDQRIDGIHAGDYVVLGARTSIGKSSLALNIARHLSQSQKVLYVTYEMPTRQLMLRLYSDLCSIDNMCIRQRRLTDEQKNDLRAAKHDIDGLHLEFAAQCPNTTGLASLVEEAAGRGVKTVIVDYLQLVRPDKPGRMSNYEHITDVSSRLRTLSKKTGVAVVGLSQLRRAQDENKPPGLSDLRESGYLEQDADVVLLLHRERHEDLSDSADLMVAKNRYGDIGSVRLHFDGRFTRFTPC